MGDVEAKIVEFLQKNGYTMITDISGALGISRVTISKYVAVMEAQGTITCRRIGPAKLYVNSAEKSIVIGGGNGQ